MLRLIFIAILSVVLVMNSAVAANSEQGSGFTRRRVRMCLKPEFTRDVAMDDDVTPEIACAAACTKLGPSCQGFHVMEKPGSSPKCRIFVFDRCSHLVRTDCDQFVWAFVRNQAGLPDGQLCPDGFGSSYFGSAYKIVNAPSWTDGQTACSGLKGLAKYADAFDRNEMLHVYSLKNSLNNGKSFHVGGWQLGSNWFWQACNVSYLTELWTPGQPEGGSQNRLLVFEFSSQPGFDDGPIVDNGASMALCECIDPFQ